jgi:hypothetical protein
MIPPHSKVRASGIPTLKVFLTNDAFSSLASTSTSEHQTKLENLRLLKPCSDPPPNDQAQIHPGGTCQTEDHWTRPTSCVVPTLQCRSPLQSSRWAYCHCHKRCTTKCLHGRQERPWSSVDLTWRRRSCLTLSVLYLD